MAIYAVSRSCGANRLLSDPLLYDTDTTASTLKLLVKTGRLHCTQYYTPAQAMHGGHMARPRPVQPGVDVLQQKPVISGTALIVRRPVITSTIQ